MDRDEAEGSERRADFLEIKTWLLWSEVVEDDECNDPSLYIIYYGSKARKM